MSDVLASGIAAVRIAVSVKGKRVLFVGPSIGATIIEDDFAPYDAEFGFSDSGQIFSVPLAPIFGLGPLSSAAAAPTP